MNLNREPHSRNSAPTTLKMSSTGTIAILGGGSWATALAKLIAGNHRTFVWYMRRQDRIDEFLRTGHNPVYLSDVAFDTSLIDFRTDINDACRRADTLVIAFPSPYLKWHTDKIDTDISRKNIVSAVKGIVPDDNMIVTDYFKHRFGCDDRNLLVIGGPCHAEEVALERLSYLTIGGRDRNKAEAVADTLACAKLRTIISGDVEGIEYGAVLKNVYAIAAGIISGMKAGDNFMAMMVSNAIREMHRFVDKVAPLERDICDSAYLGDLLVTAYSKFSRNHNFGAMIGKGYSVQAAMMEMSQIAEGYYGTKCIHDINESYGVDMPIARAVYSIIYDRMNPRAAFDEIAPTFT